MGFWLPGLVHVALALASGIYCSGFWRLAVQPVAGHSSRRVSGFEPTTIGSCVNTHFHWTTFALKVETGLTGQFLFPLSGQK